MKSGNIIHITVDIKTKDKRSKDNEMSCGYGDDGAMVSQFCDPRPLPSHVYLTLYTHLSAANQAAVS